MRKRYIDGTSWKMCKKTHSAIKQISGFMNGYISYVEIEKVEEKFVVEHNGRKTILLDNGYKRIVFLPEKQNWCVEATYDNKNNIVQWYFDMTNGNYIDKDNKPCFEDMYLDVVLLPDGEVIVFDEDELIDAYKKGEISQEQLVNTKATAERVIKEYIPNKEFTVDFFNKHLQMFINQRSV